VTSHWAQTVAAALAAAAVFALAACGAGQGETSEGEATLTVTRDYGSVPVLEAQISDPAETDTVMRALDREAEIETRYGGGFVDSIDGVEGSAVEDGRSFDWFFYVNGVESSIGAAEVPVRSGDRIWWDHRDWTDAMRVPAVVGSWPEPFDDERDSDRLRGTWDEIRDEPAARLIAQGPNRSGVFVEASGDGGLIALDERAQPAAELGPGSGLVAAVRVGEEAPTLVVTGVDEAGVGDAREMLNEEALRDRYAVASIDGEVVPLPMLEEGGG
jgi:hypothetical protein